MDALSALRLQIEWGADEALDDAPLDRRQASPAAIPAPPRPQTGRPAPALPTPALPTPALPAPALHVPAPAPGALAEAGDLAAWTAALRGFEGCALRTTAMTTVLPAGDPAAGLLLLGDAPDADDDRAGQPFAGAAGAYLDRMLASVRLDRAALRLALLVPWRPPGGRPPTETEVQACLPFLLRYLQLAPPDRLVIVGPMALRLLTGSADSLRRTRGRWRNVALDGLPGPVPAMAMQPPASVRTNPALRRDAWTDLLLLRRTIDEGAK